MFRIPMKRNKKTALLALPSGIWVMLFALVMSLSSCSRPGTPDKDPVIEVNTPRPTNNIQEHIPPERR